MNQQNMFDKPLRKYCLYCDGWADVYGSRIKENSPCPKCHKTMMTRKDVLSQFPNSDKILNNVIEQYRFYMRIWKIQNEVKGDATDNTRGEGQQ